TLRRGGEGGDAPSGSGLTLNNPLSLVPAIGFGPLLVGVSVIAAGAHQVAGDAGLMGVAAVSGIADVDAITMSLAHQVGTGLDVRVAASALVLASLVNSVLKAGMAIAIAGPTAVRHVAVPLVTAAGAGAVAAFAFG